MPQPSTRPYKARDGRFTFHRDKGGQKIENGAAWTAIRVRSKVNGRSMGHVYQILIPNNGKRPVITWTHSRAPWKRFETRLEAAKDLAR